MKLTDRPPTSIIYDINQLKRNLMYATHFFKKKKQQDLFLKWLTLPNSQKLIQQLISDIKLGKIATLLAQPSPFFTNKMANSGMSQSTMLNSPSHKQTVKVTPTTPPRNETLLDLKARSVSEDFSSLSQSQMFQKQVQIEDIPMPKLLQQPLYEQIPQFYFPDGKLTDQSEPLRLINEAFKINKLEELDATEFVQVTSNVCGLPRYLNQILFDRLESYKSAYQHQGTKGKISKQAFLKYWHLYLANKDPKHRSFMILKEHQNDYIQCEDFKPMMKSIIQFILTNSKTVLLDTHPGLEFLQATPEFQERYADTVIHRIFYGVNKRQNGRICWREYKNSNLFPILELVDKEEDINKVRQYFSYEHFYVIYCKFWELDSDHDFHISKDDFSRYSGHGLSRKVVDRIFDQIPRKFKSTIPGKMSYEDFIWFILCEEDKTTIQSIEYWFKVIDIDDNGIITGQEMEYFYEELRQRMEYLNQEPVLFPDVVCQMYWVDLLHPDNDIIFTINHFKAQLPVCGVFFNFLTNLNKLVAYEQRDPFQQKHELNEHPGYSDWDRFAAQEYLRLAMEEENPDNGEVFEGDNPWDNETDDTKTT